MIHKNYSIEYIINYRFEANRYFKLHKNKKTKYLL